MRTRCPGEGRPTLLQGAPPPRGRGGAAAARGSHSEKGGTGRGLPNSLLHGSGDGEADNQLEPTASLVSVRLGAGDEAAPGSGGLHGNLAGNASGLISPLAPGPAPAHSQHASASPLPTAACQPGTDPRGTSRLARLAVSQGTFVCGVKEGTNLVT